MFAGHQSGLVGAESSSHAEVQADPGIALEKRKSIYLPLASKRSASIWAGPAAGWRDPDQKNTLLRGWSSTPRIGEPKPESHCLRERIRLRRPALAEYIRRFSDFRFPLPIEMRREVEAVRDNRQSAIGNRQFRDWLDSCHAFKLQTPIVASWLAAGASAHEFHYPRHSAIAMRYWCDGSAAAVPGGPAHWLQPSPSSSLRHRDHRDPATAFARARPGQRRQRTPA